MTCLVCNHGIGGGEAHIEVSMTQVGDLESDLELPNGEITSKVCRDCWRWVRTIAAEPEQLMSKSDAVPIAEAEAVVDVDS